VHEVAPADAVLFASGDERRAVREFAYDDSAHFCADCAYALLDPESSSNYG
jgi:hypothetical protein